MSVLRPGTYDRCEPTPEQLEALQGLARGGQILRDVIDVAAPTPSRDKSLAITNLEQALMWAERAVLSLPPSPTAPTMPAPRVPPDPTPTQGG